MNESIRKLTDVDLLARVQTISLESNRLLGELIVLLMEVEERRLHLRKAAPSLFEFCRKQLRMSEGEAYRRINAVKLVRRFPKLLDHIARGAVHLSALVQLRDHFTEENVDELVAAAKGRNKLQIAELVARLAPRPDVPAKLRKLPQHDKGSRVTKASQPLLDPLSEARYRLQVTGDCSFRDKLLRARDLMMRTNPSGDLAVVVERALDELIEVLEKRMFGKLSRKSTSASPASLTETDGVGPAEKPSIARTKQGPASTRRPGLARASTKPLPGAERDERIIGRGGHSSPASRASHLRQRKSSRAAVSRSPSRQRTVLTGSD